MIESAWLYTLKAAPYAAMVLGAYSGYWFTQLPYWSASLGRKIVKTPAYLFGAYLLHQMYIVGVSGEAFSENFAESIVSLVGGSQATMVLFTVVFVGYTAASLGCNWSAFKETMPDDAPGSVLPL